MYNYSKLKGRIVEKYGSNTAFFNVLDISHTQGSKKLNNHAGFSQDDMVQWSKLLELEMSDIGPFFCTPQN